MAHQIHKFPACPPMLDFGHAWVLHELLREGCDSRASSPLSWRSNLVPPSCPRLISCFSQPDFTHQQKSDTLAKVLLTAVFAVSDLMSTSNLLEDQIVGSYERAEFPPGWGQDYVPEGCLERLITKESIIREFTRKDESGGEKNVDEDLPDYVLRSAKKLLAISLLNGVNTRDLHRAMNIFKSSGFDDAKLPVNSTNQLESPWSELQWSAVKLRDFKEKQWKFLVPIFREKEIKLELESLHILPFTLATKDTKQGTFGNVWEVTIHESHLEKPMRKVRRIAQQCPWPLYH